VLTATIIKAMNKFKCRLCDPVSHQVCGMSSFIALLMEAVFISETSVYFNEATRRYIPEASHLYPRRYGTLKSHICDSASKET
jgi:hypothetical protein